MYKNVDTEYGKKIKIANDLFKDSTIFYMIITYSHDVFFFHLFLYPEL